MWKLTIEDDEGKQTSLPLAHDEYGLGRAEANAIRLTDRNVSRKHAILKRNGQGWFVADLQSYNGTYVNGGRVAGEQYVKNGDVVQLGDYRLELVDESVASQLQAEPGAPAPPLPVHQRPDRLVVVVGPTPGAEFPLDREYFTIGRAEDATISINHSSVSRFHSELIAIGNGRYEIVDKGSANGIRINGVELKRGILEAGDALELGDVRMRFVGAGKIFRAGVDQSQQLQAVGAFESVAPSVRAPAMQARGSIGKVIAAGFFIGLVLVGVAVVAMRQVPPTHGDPQSVVGTEPAPPDKAAGLLAEARDLAEKNDLEGAHKKLQEIPDSSPLRDDPTFKAIEDRWAQSKLGEADVADTPAEKRRLLNLIASTPTVSPERRTAAAKMIEELDAKTAPTGKPAPPPGVPVPTGAPPNTPAGGPTGLNTPVPPTAKTNEPVAPVAPPAPGTPPDEAAMRRALEPKVMSGKASPEEIRMLKAICSHQGDRACRDRAAAMLKK